MADSFLLKEDGDYLLLENGDRIILEEAEVVPVVYCAERALGFSAGAQESNGFAPGATAATGC